MDNPTDKIIVEYSFSEGVIIMGILNDKSAHNTASKEVFHKLGHEMGNAITIIRCSLDMIKTQHPEIRDTSYFNVASGEMEYLEELVQDIKYYNQGNVPHKTIWNLDKLVRDTVASLCAAPWAAAADIVVPGQESMENIPVCADRTKIRQVLLNLVKNSCEAGATKIEISLFSSRTFRSTYEVINISDNGCGIDEAHLDTIFDPLVTYKENGTGMGLAISKEILDAHNGRIEVQSSSSGTSFNVYIPVK